MVVIHFWISHEHSRKTYENSSTMAQNGGFYAASIHAWFLWDQFDAQFDAQFQSSAFEFLKGSTLPGLCRCSTGTISPIQHLAAAELAVRGFFGLRIHTDPWG